MKNLVRIQTKKDIENFFFQNKDVLKKMFVSRIGLFGSFVRDSAKKKSDIDLLVEFIPEHKTFNNFMDLAFFFEDNLQRKIDLLTIESLSPYLKNKILSEAIFYEIR